jgi:16S rRNA G1207 methylase RsmC
VPNDAEFSSPFGTVQLERLPLDPTHTLRAWDAADQYLLEYLRESYPDSLQPLVINDQFGAIGVTLRSRNPVMVNDSFVSQQAIDANLRANGGDNLEIRDSISPLPNAAVVVLKLPKNTRYFEYLLQQLNHDLPAGTPVLIGAMLKYLSSSFFKLFEQHLDETSTTLAKKKARLLLGKTRGGYAPPRLEQARQQPEVGLTLFDTPNVFAAGKLDQGSRFFLQHFPDLSGVKEAIDLGCGNGILGLYALRENPQLEMGFVDESCQAIYATRCALEALGATDRGQLHQNHCLQGFAENSVDAVLCNPPFHQQQAVGIQTARQMFRDSARVLKADGTFYIIGNRHLGYHIELKRYFNNVKTIASDKKFVLWAAKNPQRLSNK